MISSDKKVQHKNWRPKFRRFSEKEINKIIFLKRKGLSNKEIAKEMKCSPSTITRYLHNFMSDYEFFSHKKNKKELLDILHKKKKRDENSKKLKESLEEKRKLMEHFGEERIMGYELFKIKYQIPAQDKLKDLIHIPKISEKEEDILNSIRIISSRLFMINKNRSYKLILGTSIYLNTSLRLREVSELLNISNSSINTLLTLIRIKKQKRVLK